MIEPSAWSRFSLISFLGLLQDRIMTKLILSTSTLTGKMWRSLPVACRVIFQDLLVIYDVARRFFEVLFLTGSLVGLYPIHDTVFQLLSKCHYWGLVYYCLGSSLVWWLWRSVVSLALHRSVYVTTGAVLIEVKIEIFLIVHLSRRFERITAATTDWGSMLWLGFERPWILASMVVQVRLGPDNHGILGHLIVLLLRTLENLNGTVLLLLMAPFIRSVPLWGRWPALNSERTMIFLIAIGIMHRVQGLRLLVIAAISVAQVFDTTRALFQNWMQCFLLFLHIMVESALWGGMLRAFTFQISMLLLNYLPIAQWEVLLVAVGIGARLTSTLVATAGGGSMTKRMTSDSTAIPPTDTFKIGVHDY